MLVLAQKLEATLTMALAGLGFGSTEIPVPPDLGFQTVFEQGAGAEVARNLPDVTIEAEPIPLLSPQASAPAKTAPPQHHIVELAGLFQPEPELSGKPEAETKPEIPVDLAVATPRSEVPLLAKPEMPAEMAAAVPRPEMQHLAKPEPADAPPFSKTPKIVEALLPLPVIAGAGQLSEPTPEVQSPIDAKPRAPEIVNVAKMQGMVEPALTAATPNALKPEAAQSVTDLKTPPTPPQSALKPEVTTPVSTSQDRATQPQIAAPEARNTSGQRQDPIAEVKPTQATQATPVSTETKPGPQAMTEVPTSQPPQDPKAQAVSTTAIPMQPAKTVSPTMTPIDRVAQPTLPEVQPATIQAEPSQKPLPTPNTEAPTPAFADAEVPTPTPSADVDLQNHTRQSPAENLQQLSNAPSPSTPHAPTRIENAPVLTAPQLQATTTQIAQHMANGATEFDIALNPVELGQVRIGLSIEAGAVTLNVQADRADALDLLRRSADSLIAELADLGYSDISMAFGGQSEQKDSDEPSPQAPANDPEIAELPSPFSAPVAASTSTLDLRL